MVPSVSTMKCEHTPGISPRCRLFAAKVFHALENDGPSV